MKFHRLSSQRVYQGRVFDVRVDQVRLPDDQEIRLDIVDHSGAVTLVPVDENREMHLIRQYRHPVEEVLLELPAGTLEEGEDPTAAAQRELREETGMRADVLQHIGSFFLAPGYSTEKMYVYLATGLVPDPLPGDVDELLEVQILPCKKVYAAAEAGEIQDGKSLAALFLARGYLLS